ncbi:MAG: MMPL family transporter [Planctomycetota bacterium]
MTIRERVLRRIAVVSCDHARAVVVVFAAVTALAVAAIALRGRVSTDLTDVLPRKSKEAALYVEAAEHFAADILIIAFESENPLLPRVNELARAFAGYHPERTDAAEAYLEELVRDLDNSAPMGPERSKICVRMLAKAFKSYEPSALRDAARNIAALPDLLQYVSPSRLETARDLVESISSTDVPGARAQLSLAKRSVVSLARVFASGEPSALEKARSHVENLSGFYRSDAREQLRTARHSIMALARLVKTDDVAKLEAAKPYVEALAKRLPLLERTLPDGGSEKLVRSVDYKVGEKARAFAREIAEERGYLFLDAEDRKALAAKIESGAIEKQMVENRRKYEAMGAEYFERRIVPDPLNLYAILARHRGEAGGQFVPKEGESYIVSPDGTMLIMLVQATRPVKDIAFDQDFMVAVREAEARLWDELASADPAARAELKGRLASEGIDVPDDPAAWAALRRAVRLSHTGGYAIAENENRLLRHDLMWCFATSLVFVLAIFALGFRRLGALFYIGLPLVASVTWTLAAAFMVFGHISMMSGGFAAILVGLSVDFAIHIYNTYVCERARGTDVRAAIEGALTGSGSGIFFGALTSSVAFFGVMLTRFVGLKEFGFLAGIGVLLGMTAMFFVLPALLYLRSRVAEESEKATQIYGFHLQTVANAVERRPGVVFGVAAGLALAAAVFVYTTMTVYFFDSDLKNLRSESEVLDLGERIQRRFGTSLAPIVALSRGATPDEALTKAATLLDRVRGLRDGVSVARASWPEDEPALGRPFVRVDGCDARVRRVEIVLPRDALLPKPLAPTTEVLARPDGSRLVVYKFATEGDLADWEFEGEGVFYPGSVELRSEGGRGTTMRWRHELAGSAEVIFSVRYLGDVRVIAMGLGERAGARGQAGGPPAGPGGPCAPTIRDQVRLTLVVRAEPVNGEWSVEFVAGRGTVQSTDSVVRLIPPGAVQAASAKFVASIDVDRVADDVDEYARAAKLNPVHFEEFLDRLRGMVERAREPRYLTLEEIASSEFGALLAKYYAEVPGDADGPVHTVATYLYPEQGEMPREWYARVGGALEGTGEVTAGRLVSLAIRDIVREDFSWLTGLVFAGVALSLLWSFRSLRWSVAALGPVFASFALMLATLLVIGHRLNFMNVLVFPILVGIGIDYGIHVVHRFRDGAPVRAIITETGRAFVLTTLTTMAGFGSLVISRYKGLSSFGFVTILGMLFVLLTSLVALPAMLAIVERRRAAGAGGASRGRDTDVQGTADGGAVGERQ